MSQDGLFYDYLLSVAPPEQRKIISAIRKDDGRKHNRLFRELYWELTGRDTRRTLKNLSKNSVVNCDGLTRALFGELAAVEKYGKILFGFEYLPYPNIMTEIYTDEMKHATKWSYLLL